MRLCLFSLTLLKEYLKLRASQIAKELCYSRADLQLHTLRFPIAIQQDLRMASRVKVEPMVHPEGSNIAFGANVSDVDLVDLSGN